MTFELNILILIILIFIIAGVSWRIGIFIMDCLIKIAFLDIDPFAKSFQSKEEEEE